MPGSQHPRQESCANRTSTIWLGTKTAHFPSCENHMRGYEICETVRSVTRTWDLDALGSHTEWLSLRSPHKCFNLANQQLRRCRRNRRRLDSHWIALVEADLAPMRCERTLLVQ